MPLFHGLHRRLSAQSGHLSRITDALGHVTEFTHDPNGKLQAHSLPDGAHQSYGWDAAGRLSEAREARDALSRSTRFAWSLRSQLTVREDGEGRQVALQYDNARRLARLTNENGETFAFEYNAADQMVAEHRIGGQRVTLEYDPNGWPVATCRWRGWMHRARPQNKAGWAPPTMRGQKLQKQ